MRVWCVCVDVCGHICVEYTRRERDVSESNWDGAKNKSEIYWFNRLLSIEYGFRITIEILQMLMISDTIMKV